jgi:hypothetical protein
LASSEKAGSANPSITADSIILNSLSNNIIDLRCG